MAEFLSSLWELFTDNGYTVFDTFVSFADIFIFVILASLFIWLINKLLGGD